MSLPVACPECEYEYEVAKKLAGRCVLCPKCHERFRIGSDQPRAYPAWLWALAITLGLAGVGTLTVALCLVMDFNPFSLPSPASSGRPTGTEPIRVFLSQSNGPALFNRTTVLWVDARLDSHFTMGYGPDGTWTSIELADADGDTTIWGFVRRGSDLDTRLQTILKDGKKHRLTVTVRDEFSGGVTILDYRQ
jgi:hypothetical protein